MARQMWNLCALTFPHPGVVLFRELYNTMLHKQSESLSSCHINNAHCPTPEVSSVSLSLRSLMRSSFCPKDGIKPRYSQSGKWKIPNLGKNRVIMRRYLPTSSDSSKEKSSERLELSTLFLEALLSLPAAE